MSQLCGKWWHQKDNTLIRLCVAVCVCTHALALVLALALSLALTLCLCRTATHCNTLWLSHVTMMWHVTKRDHTLIHLCVSICVCIHALFLFRSFSCPFSRSLSLPLSQRNTLQHTVTESSRNCVAGDNKGTTRWFICVFLFVYVYTHFSSLVHPLALSLAVSLAVVLVVSRCLSLSLAFIVTLQRTATTVTETCHNYVAGDEMERHVDSSVWFHLCMCTCTLSNSFFLVPWLSLSLFLSLSLSLSPYLCRVAGDEKGRRVDSHHLFSSRRINHHELETCGLKSHELWSMFV